MNEIKPKMVRLEISYDSAIYVRPEDIKSISCGNYGIRVRVEGYNDSIDIYFRQKQEDLLPLFEVLNQPKEEKKEGENVG